MLITGNIAFRKILVKNYDNYTNGDDADKMVLVDFLSHQMMTTLGVRFLKVAPQDNQSWVVVDDKKVIRSKFCQAFRNIRASYRRMAEQQHLEPYDHFVTRPRTNNA
jgi:hypothetical protein